MADPAIRRRDVDLASAGSADLYTARNCAVDCGNTSADTTSGADNDVTDNTPGHRWNLDLAHPVAPEEAATADPFGRRGTHDDRFMNPASNGRHDFVDGAGGLQEHAAMNHSITGRSVLVVHARRFDHDVPFYRAVDAGSADCFVAFGGSVTTALKRRCRLRHPERGCDHGRRENYFYPHEAHNSKTHRSTLSAPWGRTPFQWCLMANCPSPPTQDAIRHRTPRSLQIIGASR